MTQDEKNSKLKKFLTSVYERYRDKNVSYGDSFNKNIQKFGLIAGLIQISQKIGKLEALIQEDVPGANEKEITETLFDLITFLAMMKVSNEERLQREGRDPLFLKEAVSYGHINIHCFAETKAFKDSIIGGYGAVIHLYPVVGSPQKENLSGVFNFADNEVEPKVSMEIISCIEALKVLVFKCRKAESIELYTNSRYVATTFQKNEAKSGQISWWKVLDRILQEIGCPVRIHWTEEEDQNVFHNEAEILANQAIQKKKVEMEKGGIL